MRSFATVHPQFWTGKTGKELRKVGADVQVLALYLITCHHAHMSGVYYIPRQTMTYETGMTMKVVDSALRVLRSLEFAFYDEESEHIWVKEMLAWQVKEIKPEDHRVKGIVKWCNSLPSVSFIERFYGRYYSFLPGLKPLLSPIEAPSEGQQEGLTSPTIPIPDPVLSLVQGKRGLGKREMLPVKSFGNEFESVRLNDEEYGKLKGKLNSHLDDYITRLDRYSQTRPKEFNAYKSHYAVLMTWFDRDVKEGRVKSHDPPASRRPTEEAIRREEQLQFGDRVKPK